MLVFARPQYNMTVFCSFTAEFIDQEAEEDDEQEFQEESMGDAPLAPKIPKQKIANEDEDEEEDDDDDEDEE